VLPPATAEIVKNFNASDEISRNMSWTKNYVSVNLDGREFHLHK
jgi:hypothetical protein